MIRRRLILKRVDPWSVLKFGFVVNVALMFVGMLGFWILWIVVGQLGLVEQFCDSVGSIVLDLRECALNGANIFRTLLLLGLLGVVVQTGIMVFGAFLYNLIADLTGGLGFTFLDESGDTAMTAGRPATGTSALGRVPGSGGSPAYQAPTPGAGTPGTGTSGAGTTPRTGTSPGGAPGRSDSLWKDPRRSDDRT